MRAYWKGWQSDRPLKRDSRRVKWYEGTIGDTISIRIVFEDGDRRVTRFYTDYETAQADYGAFMEGTLTTLELSKR